MKEMFKRRIVILLIVMFVFGLITTITGTIDSSKASRADQDFNAMTKADFKDGMYVGGRVYEIYDEFAYEESYEESFGVKHNERVTTHYYAVPMYGSFNTDTPMYIAVEISHKDAVEQAEKLMQQTWDYYDTGIEPTLWNEFDILGEVYPLEGELDQYFYEWYSYGDATVTRADYEKHVCPWVIKHYSVSGNKTAMGFSIGMMIIGGVGIGILLFIFLKSRSEAIPTTGNPYGNTNYTGASDNNSYDDRPMPPDSGTDYWGSPSADDDRPLPPDSGASYWGSSPEQDVQTPSGGTMGYAQKPSLDDEMPSVSTSNNSLYQETSTSHTNNYTDSNQ